MYEIEKKEMVRISNYCGDRVDYVQGGGGNTSVKFDDKLMAIKASGYTLKEATQDKGYVTVNYRNIKKYYNEVDPGADTDFEKESLLLNMDSIVLLDGMENKRPSVEVGLHSFLNRCVIHTHSVYANMLCCAAEGQNIAKEIF
ncbi:MAG: class II aldolase, partial [Clostridia bacterium]|nr:class II aldolase [Clostridia bacterium]